jgi:hypothetical protein
LKELVPLKAHVSVYVPGTEGVDAVTLPAPFATRFESENV